MRELIIDRDGVGIYSRVDGPDDAGAPTIVFANSLATTLHLWDQVLPFLPKGLRVIRYDLRGHGRSDVPQGPYSMGQLVSDAAAVCDAHGVQNALFVGLSVGGMIAQGLAVKRPDVIRAIVLSNTGAKIGTPDIWKARIDAALDNGMAALSDATMDRWFGRDFHGTAAMAPWKDMFEACDPVGFAGVGAAISGTDFISATSGLRIPALGIAGSEDGGTPADLVRETTDLIPGSRFELMRRCGHLPCAEAPEPYAKLLTDFIDATGHMSNAL